MVEYDPLYKSAILSGCDTYRYILRRIWSTDVAPALFIGLNPSTADATEDDPTIRRCVGFARDWNCGGLVMVNLFAYRATNPKTLLSVVDPVGPENDDHLRQELKYGDPVIAAWGANKIVRLRDHIVTAMALYRGQFRCLGLTKGGHPRHPLYLQADTILVPFSVRSQEGGE